MMDEVEEDNGVGYRVMGKDEMAEEEGDEEGNQDREEEGLWRRHQARLNLRLAEEKLTSLALVRRVMTDEESVC